MKILVLLIFAASIGFIFIYSLIQLNLIINYLQAKKRKQIAPKIFLEGDLPFVTIQLPLYNELYVVERLINCICKLDYPIAKLEIQVLDDSDDESFEIAARKVTYFQAQGINIQHIKRPKREGFKAGALAYGTEICAGEFIAIFDADFLPAPDFLLRALPYFHSPNIGVVQSKWSYINADYSFLTKLQAFGLNAHFSIEQVGRNSKNHFINFNGTAGIWRKSCIIDAGGWQSDTLTEDLDLSYRAQLKQWKFEYVEEICSPSELPVEINALKAQQYRWTKGAAECVRKNLPRVIRSKNIPLRTKIHAIFHLMNSSIFVFILLISLLAMPVIIIKPQLAEYIYLYRISGFFMISWFILAGFYWVSFSYDHPDKRKLLVTFLYQFPLFLAISMGLGLHNCIAVFEGWIGRKTPFVRTPKFNINAQNKNWEENKYNVKKLGSLIYFELAMLMYFTFSFITAVNYKDYGLMPMILLLIFGYGIVVFNSIFNFKKTATKFLYKYEV